jgi:hypothetical protein
MQFAGFDDFIEIFKGGSQTDSQGREQDGDALIDQALATFNTAEHEPPIVIGHPIENAPAFGWVQKLKIDLQDGVKVLLAKFKDVVPEFADMVKKGLFKKRSASFYPDGRLRHVGFLGAMPPAVKGLADLKFGDEDEVLTFEFAATDVDKAAQEKRAAKYKIGIKTSGHVTKPGEWENVPDDQFLDPVNFRYPCPDADQTRSAASYWGQADNQAQYTPDERSVINERLDKFKKQFKIGEYRKEVSMSVFKQKFTNFLDLLGVDMSKVPEDALPENIPAEAAAATYSEADIDAAKKEAAEQERDKVAAEFAEENLNQQRAARQQEISDWCDSLVEAGKVAPAWIKAGFKEFAQALDAETEIKFGEDKKSTGLDWFKAFIEELPKLINFEEIARRDQDVQGGNAGGKIEALIKEKQKENQNLTYGAAFSEVQVEHPDLALEYQNELRA